MARCALCDRQAADPGKGPSDWKRAVLDDEQVLVCPACQQRDPTWIERASSCPDCASKRLYKAMGDTVCRDCGRQWSPGPDDFRP